MTSSLNKNIFLNKERSISLSYAPKESLLNSFKMSDKKYILKNNEIKRYTSDNKINKNENIKISYKKLFEKKNLYQEIIKILNFIILQWKMKILFLQQ